MHGIVTHLWLIPALPLLAAGLTAFAGTSGRLWAASMAIGSMILSFFLACGAFVITLEPLAAGGLWRETFDFQWLKFGNASLRLGWVLDPLSAVMVVMVTLVGALIFIYSLGYMAHDENVARFFGFLALFAAAMLGLVIANNLLLLFICWEVVGLASYLLIGFWYHKPSAAAAATKAFIVTRIGDLGLFLGMLWLYAETGTLQFYDHGHGCLEQPALTSLVTHTIGGGMLASTAIALLIFWGAMGKSGQAPLHVWLPDAMEGPTPVSALIHAATMVAAGVFLVARMHPLMSAHPAGAAAETTALGVVTWVGAITAVFAALIAVAQTDIKRILAYSTVSQLGYMMLGIGVGGVAVGLFHLITHAFFKALLFLGAGSVIHGCHGEQDIRRMGGLRSLMPTTFATYAVGMMALCGVPLFFSGFWSKDEILHSALGWPVSRGPFYLGVFGALLTAFYMTRQMIYVFFGTYRGGIPKRAGEAAETGERTSSAAAPFALSNALDHSNAVAASCVAAPGDGRTPGSPHDTRGSERGAPRESSVILTLPLGILAVFAVLLGLVGTPFWPWFHAYLTGHIEDLRVVGTMGSAGVATVMVSTLIVTAGIGLGWWTYGRRRDTCAAATDPLAQLQPDLFSLLEHKCFMDEFYEMTFVKAHAWLARGCDWLDRMVWNGLVQAVAWVMTGFAWLNHALDEFVVNRGFDSGCDWLRSSGRLLSLWQNGQVQRYLRVLGLALVVVALVFLNRS